MRRFTKEEVIERMRKKIREGKPIIVTGAGSGLHARALEMGGADVIGCYASCRLVEAGFSSSAAMVSLLNANDVSFEYGTREVLRVVKNTPVQMGVAFYDPLKDMETYLKQIKEAGFAGVQNYPSLPFFGPASEEAPSGYVNLRIRLLDAGFSFEQECNSFRIANELGLFTVGYCIREEDAKMLAKVPVDFLCPHMGLTKHPYGGPGAATSQHSLLYTIEEAAKRTQRMIEVAKAANPGFDFIFLSHGGPMSSPEEVKYVLDHTDAVGHVAAITVQNAPIERAVSEAVKAFGSLTMKKVKMQH